MMDPDKVSVTQNVHGYHRKIVGGNIIHGDAYITVHCKVKTLEGWGLWAKKQIFWNNLGP